MIMLAGREGTRPSPVSSVVEFIGGSLGRVLGVIALWLLLLVVRALGRRIIERTLRRARTRAPGGLAGLPTGTLLGVSPERRGARLHTLRSVLRSALGAGLLITGVLGTGMILGVDLAPLLAGAGLLGVAIAFGAQSLVRDVLSGLFLLAEDQLGVGDRVDVGVGVSGVIEHVGLRTTQMRGDTGTLWHLRNGELLRIGNITQGWEQLDLRVSGTTRSSARIRTLLETTIGTHQAQRTSGGGSSAVFDPSRDIGLVSHDATSATWSVRVSFRGDRVQERGELIEALVAAAARERLRLTISAT